MRRVLVGLLVVAVLAFLGDALATNVAEARAAERVAAELGASVDVDLRGWPVSLRLLNRHVPEVGLVATDVPLRDTPASLTRLEATLTDVAVPWTWTGRLDGVVEARGGTFAAELDEAAVQSLVDLPVTISLEEGIIRGSVGTAQLDATAEVVDGAIVLRPAASALAELGELRVPLDGLPQGAVVESVRVEPDVLLIAGSVSGFRIGADDTNP